MQSPLNLFPNVHLSNCFMYSSLKSLAFTVCPKYDRICNVHPKKLHNQYPWIGYSWSNFMQWSYILKACGNTLNTQCPCESHSWTTYFLTNNQCGPTQTESMLLELSSGTYFIAAYCPAHTLWRDIYYLEIFTTKKKLLCSHSVCKQCLDTFCQKIYIRYRCLHKYMFV